MTYDFPDVDDPAKLNLAKVESLTKQLKGFAADRDNDLVVIVDGSDVWFQLPPDILIRRYHTQLDIQNAKLASKIGSSVMRKKDIRQSILFEVDKACWPNDDWSVPACWAVPASPLPEHRYGPYDDSVLEDARQDPYHARPRWLNSGSIMGPVKDLRIMYEEISRKMHDEHHADWDQVYYSEIFGIQEYSRLQLEPQIVTPPDNATVPMIKPDQMVEFHIGLDYGNEMFQAVGYENPYLTWVPHDGSMDVARPKKTPLKSPHQFKLPSELIKARQPFEMMQRLKTSDYNEKYQEILKSAGSPSFKVWRHLPLATNVVTKSVFPLIHFSFEKDFRNTWWQNMWFYPYARDLLKSSSRATGEPLYPKKINGRKWYNSQAPEGPYDDRFSKGRRDGAFTGDKAWRSFGELCIAHNEFLFGANYDNTVLRHD